MSLITYNSISLPYSFTPTFNQEVVYDESGTDPLYTKFDIRVQAIINPNYLSAILPALTGANGPSTTNPAAIMNCMRQTLLTPRKSLSFIVNGVQQIPQAQTGNVGFVDANNGPQPKYCNILTLTSNSYLIDYAITAWYIENNSPINKASVTNQPGNAVISNRWTERIDIDQQQFSTRTREGKYIIRSDNIQGMQVDDFRESMAVVGVPQGFMRKSSSYTVDKNGLGLQYTVVDQEVFKQPPPGAYEAEGSYTETSTKGGYHRSGVVTVRLKGAKDTDQATLLALATQIASSKLNTAANQAGVGNYGLQIMTFATAKVDMYRNEVEVEMRGIINPGDQKQRINTIAGIRGFDANFFQTPLSPPGTNPPIYTSRGTAQFMLQAAAYYDPKLTALKLGDGGQLNPGYPVGTLGKNQES